ncbi:MAG: hypothetical protein NZ954_00445 [Thermofilaceae archaeon]|nr:hypothetical protein [Thermofilaceae archaeon]MCX8180351.1 hypothetical protein [Thermofilaceae archaeon]MDW8003886.1 hypothetical protein [Thermofilaceae archaeon]
MRHLEAAALGLVFAVATVYMASLTARQISPVHHGTAQRALAWALLNARNVDELVQLIQQGLGEHLAALYVDGQLKSGGEGLSELSVCYAAVFFELETPHVVKICITP